MKPQPIRNCLDGFPQPKYTAFEAACIRNLFATTRDHIRNLIRVGLAGGADLGTRSTFADLGATVAEALGISWSGAGRSFLP